MVYFCLFSEHMSSLSTLPSSVSDAAFASPSLGLPSATPSPSMGLPSGLAQSSSSANTSVSRVESSGSRTLPPHLGFSQSKDLPSPAAGPITVNEHMIVQLSSRLDHFRPVVQRHTTNHLNSVLPLDH